MVSRPPTVQPAAFLIVNLRPGIQLSCLIISTPLPQLVSESQFPEAPRTQSCDSSRYHSLGGQRVTLHRRQARGPRVPRRTVTVSTPQFLVGSCPELLMRERREGPVAPPTVGVLVSDPCTRWRGSELSAACVGGWLSASLPPMGTHPFILLTHAHSVCSSMNWTQTPRGRSSWMTCSASCRSGVSTS